MSFIDYGFDIFSISSDYQKDAYQSCGDYILGDETLDSNVLKNSCPVNIINHLISLGSCTEKELEIVRRELQNYQSLKLTKEQIIQLKDVSELYKSDYEYGMEI
jgi:hypothetical protein